MVTISDSLQFNKDLREDNLNVDILHNFLNYGGGFFFGDNYIIVKLFYQPLPHQLSLEPPEPESELPDSKSDYLKIQFPIGVSILSTTKETIVYGIKDKIEITFEHVRLGVLKSRYKVYDDTYKNIEIELFSVLDEVEEYSKTIKPVGEEFEFQSTVQTDGIKLHNGKKSLIINNPDNEVTINKTTNRIVLSLPVDAKYPFEFDPTITTSSLATNGNSGARHVILLPDNMTYLVMYIDNNSDARMATSIDQGLTWNTEAVYTGTVTQIAFDVDGTGRIVCAFMQAGNFYIIIKAVIGGWGGASLVWGAGLGGVDIAIGPNNKWQAVMWLTGGNPKIYKRDEDGDLKTVSQSNYDSKVAGISVASTNRWHVIMANGASAVTINRKLRWAEGQYGAGIGTAMDIITTPIDYRIGHPTIILDENDVPHVACIDAQNVQVGTYNIRYANRIGGAWGVLENVTNIGAVNHQYYPSIGITKNGTIHIYWAGVGYGAFPAKRQILHRERAIDGTWTPVLAADPELITNENKDHVDPHVIRVSPNTQNTESGMPCAYINVDDTDLIWYDPGNIVYGAVPGRTSFKNMQFKGYGMR